MYHKYRKIMKTKSTLLLKTAIIALAAFTIFVCIAIFPGEIILELRNDFDFGYLIILMMIAAAPFLFALYQALKILGLIDRNMAFSNNSTTALRNIKICALIISGLYALTMPYIFRLAEVEDAPGLALIGFMIVGASFVIATAADVFQKLLQNAIDIKSENDLTV